MGDQASTVQWPEKPTCHGETSRYTGEPISWQQRGATRHCSWCGSMHPEDLLRALDGGARLGGSDWKYGYPHKFYVHAAVGGGMAGKWYNDHLRDAGYSEDALTLLMETLFRQSGIAFFRDASGEVMYRAPYFGYQR